MSHEATSKPPQFSVDAITWIAAVAGVSFAIQAFVSRYLFWDSYFGLVAGRSIVTNGIPHTEVLTSAGKPVWIDQQWLAHVWLFEAWSLGGYATTAFLSALSVTLAFTLLAALMVRRGVPGRRAFFWSLAALAVALGSTVVRAQSFSLPLAVLMLWAVLSDSERASFRRGFLLVVPVLVVWANVHGSVLLAAGLVAAYAAARAAVALARGDQRSAALYALASGAAVAAVFATPYGVEVMDYYRALLESRTIHLFILEWAPPSLENPYSLAFFAMLAATCIVVVYGLANGCRPPLIPFIGAAGLAVLAFTGVRFQVWFGLVGAVLSAEIFVRTTRPAQPLARLFTAGIAATAGVAALFGGFVLATTSESLFEQTLPLGAMAATAAYAENNANVRILTDELGSALLWKHPTLAGLVAFDARLEQYSDESLLAWFQFLNGLSPGWPQLTSDYDVVVASAFEHPALAARLAGLPGWTILYSEPNGTAFVRHAP